MRVTSHQPQEFRNPSASRRITSQQQEQQPAGPSESYTGGIFSKAEAAEAEAAARTPSAQARPEVSAQIEAVKNLPIAGIKHTTRGMPRMEFFTPSAPQPFSAGRFQVDFEKPDGSLTGVIFETEAGPGHLATVVPGETPIPGGYIAFLSNPDDSHSTESPLNDAETKQFIEGLYGRFSQPMTAKQAERADSVIAYAFAIHNKEGGQGSAVQAAHQQLATQVKASQPGEANHAGGWNLRG